MPSTHGEHRSQRASPSPAEKAKLDRRIARAIQQGTPITRLRRQFGVTRNYVEAVAAHFALTITTGPKGGANRW